MENNRAELEVNGTHYSVEVNREMPQQPRTPVLVRSAVPPPKPEETVIARKESAGGMPIKAPLPGTVLNVLVKPGDAVKKGDILLRIEAMKMENDINAEKACKVLAVKVKPGDAVLQNDVLIEVE